MTIDSVYNNIDNGSYLAQVAHPAFDESMDQTNPSKDEFREALRLHRLSTKKAEFKFRIDAMEACGLSNIPAANKVFDYAWSLGHAAGFHEVMMNLQDLSGIILEVLKGVNNE